MNFVSTCSQWTDVGGYSTPTGRPGSDDLYRPSKPETRVSVSYETEIVSFRSFRYPASPEQSQSVGGEEAAPRVRDSETR